MDADETDDPADAAPEQAAPGLLARLDALRREYLAKGLRYLAVSAFNVVFGQTLLFGFQTIGGFEPVAANMAAVSISASWPAGVQPARRKLPEGSSSDQAFSS